MRLPGWLLPLLSLLALLGAARLVRAEGPSRFVDPFDDNLVRTPRLVSRASFGVEVDRPGLTTLTLRAQGDATLWNGRLALGANVPFLQYTTGTVTTNSVGTTESFSSTDFGDLRLRAGSVLHESRGLLHTFTTVAFRATLPT